MFGTTREFLDYFSLAKLDDLPPLSDIQDLDDLNIDLGLPEPGPQGDLVELLEVDSTGDQTVAETPEVQLEDETVGDVIPITRSESR
jgi:segregation and condensation protein B